MNTIRVKLTNLAGLHSQIWFNSCFLECWLAGGPRQGGTMVAPAEHANYWEPTEGEILTFDYDLIWAMKVANGWEGSPVSIGGWTYSEVYQSTLDYQSQWFNIEANRHYILDMGTGVVTEEGTPPGPAPSRGINTPMLIIAALVVGGIAFAIKRK